MALLEGLERRHEVVPARDAGCDDPLGDARRDGAFDDRGDGVHGADDFGLELWGYVELDLLEEVFRGAEATDDEDVLEGLLVGGLLDRAGDSWAYLEHSILSLNGDDLVADKL